MTPTEELSQILGPDTVFTDKDYCFNASFDGSKISVSPSAVIQAQEASQVGEVLKLANKYKVPVTARGAGSSLTGSASATYKGWVIDLTALNSISIDPLSKIATVGTGAVTSDIQNTAKELNLFYPPDPASRDFCTIGGNIACNAGGLRGVKYGVTRDYILALEGYLPTGEFVQLGKPLKKFACGYNLRDLWIGSEGTLGIITQASLKLLPLPKTSWTGVLHFEKDSQAVETALSLLRLPILPCAVEFLDTLTTGDQATLILEFDGPKESISQELEVLKEWTQSNNLASPDTFNEKNSEKIWQYRRDCSASMFKHGKRKLNEDIVVPLDQVQPLLTYIDKLKNDLSLKIPVFGHLGDGNLHVNIMYNEDQKSQAAEALNQLMHTVIDLGGAISGEHGIGIAKSPFIKDQIGTTVFDLMKTIKTTLDPNNILNPEKIFTPQQIWDFDPVDAKLPWDKK